MKTQLQLEIETAVAQRIDRLTETLQSAKASGREMPNTEKLIAMLTEWLEAQG